MNVNAFTSNSSIGPCFYKNSLPIHIPKLQVFFAVILNHEEKFCPQNILCWKLHTHHTLTEELWSTENLRMKVQWFLDCLKKIILNTKEIFMRYIAMDITLWPAAIGQCNRTGQVSHHHHKSKHHNEEGLYHWFQV